MINVKKKPWPADAIMIVASLAGKEIREKMQGVYPAKCRECGAELHADTWTVSRAENSPLRYGRPIKFFCIECAVQHDNQGLVIEDHRTEEGKRRAEATR